MIVLRPDLSDEDRYDMHKRLSSAVIGLSICFTADVHTGCGAHAGAVGNWAATDATVRCTPGMWSWPSLRRFSARRAAPM